MTKVEEFEHKVLYAKNKSDEWWIALYEEFEEYLKIASEEERIRLTRLGCGEMLSMVYESIMSKRDKEFQKEMDNWRIELDKELDKYKELEEYFRTHNTLSNNNPINDVYKKYFEKKKQIYKKYNIKIEDE